jgi:MarR family transcriptional regulator, organic hydroperoxide resistance regulator
METAGRERLYHLLQTAAHQLKVRADRAAQSLAGISAAQASVLFVLAREGATSQKTVARQLGLNESAVTGMVGRLTAMGLVRREPSPSDGRAWSITLTAEGETALKQFRTVLDSLNRDLAAALGGDADVARLAADLRAIAGLDGQKADGEAPAARNGDTHSLSIIANRLLPDDRA